MLKVCVFAVLAAMLWGCAMPTAARKGPVEWPDEASTPLVVPSVEAGAALAAAAAIREMVRTNTDPRLFRGCSSPEQGLNVAVFKDPTSGLYYVVLSQHFNRCGGPRVRVLDGWYEYAVTPQGEVVAEAPPMAGEYVAPPRSNAPSPEQTAPPISPTPETEADRLAPTLSPAPVPLPAPEAPPTAGEYVAPPRSNAPPPEQTPLPAAQPPSKVADMPTPTPPPAPTPPRAPEAPPSAAPSPALPPLAPPTPGTPEPAPASPIGK
jgi:hypothetical protein